MGVERYQKFPVRPPLPPSDLSARRATFCQRVPREAIKNRARARRFLLPRNHDHRLARRIPRRSVAMILIRFVPRFTRIFAFHVVAPLSLSVFAGALIVIDEILAPPEPSVTVP
jgi:hypothetical protein